MPANISQSDSKEQSCLFFLYRNTNLQLILQQIDSSGFQEPLIYFFAMQFSSKLLAEAVDAFSGLPGIGRKSALRLALYLIRQDKDITDRFVEALARMRRDIRQCRQCYNISDTEICSLCSDVRRDKSIVCVVEHIRDVMAIEDTGQFRGLYHVLGGVISPIEGIGPDQLYISPLIERVSRGEIREIILAISPTIEGETTNYYISKKLHETGVRISVIARGISFGGELEYADELTLGRSIAARTPYVRE